MQTKQTHPHSIVNIKLEPSGQLNFEGELNKESSEVLDKLLQQAEYYRAKATQLEQKQIETANTLDSITMVFIGFVLCLLMFGSYSAVRAIRSVFHPCTISFRLR